MIIGLLSAPWCYGLVELVKDKLVIDDALDVFAVHGMGGFLGTLCIGIFADENVGGVKASGELFGKSWFAAAVGTAYAYAVGFALVKVIETFRRSSLPSTPSSSASTPPSTASARTRTPPRTAARRRLIRTSPDA